jgi:uncharacterized protein YbjT (DUF2867 family)
MRVLLTGATGLIGGAIARALLARGHDVRCAVRDPARLRIDHPRCSAIAADLSQIPSSDWWRGQLAGVDAVVNAVGILREQGGQTFDALHAQAPAELFRACAQAGVPCAVQVSALGAAADAPTDYFRSKHAADEVLRGLPLRGAVVQPSLVFDPHGPSSGLFLTLASAPMLMLPAGGSMDVQPVLLQDVVDGVVALLEQPPGRVETIPFVGARSLSFRAYLATLREQLGMGTPALVLPMPSALFVAAGRIAGHVPGSFLDRDTAVMLLRGNAAPAQRFAQVLGREPAGVRSFVRAADAPALRTRSVLTWTLPALRVALAFLWIWTALVSFGLYPVEDSKALLARVGLHGALATFALYGAAVLDLLLGLLTLWAPRGWRGPVWAAQLALIGGYTVLITLFLPEYWLHPYGPISKNLPIMAAIALLWALEPRAR